MKRLLTLAILGISSAALAGTCPDISGVYRTTDKILLKFEQTDCAQLSKSFGITKEDGTGVKWITTQVYKLDGTALCTTHEHCESVTATADTVSVRLNFNGSVATADHGKCIQTGYDLSKNDKADLSANFLVKDCADHFTGMSARVFPHVTEDKTCESF